MARNTAKITIDKEGSRDIGRTYLLTELSATDAEEWAIRAFMSAAKSGVMIPDNLRDLGLAGIAMLGMQALSGMHFDDAKPLLDKMFECVQFVTSKNIVRPIAQGDIEEVSTRFQLRKEIIELHTGFFASAARLNLEREQAAAAQSASQDTSTSPSDSQS